MSQNIAKTIVEPIPVIQGDQQIPRVGISDRPTSIVFNGKLYIFHQGSIKCGQLWYSSFENDTFVDHQILNVHISGSPSVIEVFGILYCYFNDNGKLKVIRSSDLRNWTTPQEVDKVNLPAEGSPNIIIYENKLYCFHEGTQANTFYYAILAYVE